MKNFLSKLIISTIVLFSLVSFTFVQAANIYPILGALTGGGTGALDKIDGAILSAGDGSIVVLSSGVYHYTNIQDSEAENSPYVIRPDTNPGTNSWHLVVPQGPMSHVRAMSDSGQSLPDSTHTYVIFEDEVYDTLSEYVAASGIFTAKYAGYYHVSCIWSITSAVWAAGKQASAYLYINSVRYQDGDRVQPEFTGIVKLRINATIYLAANDTIRLDMYHDQGGTVSLVSTASYNSLTIDRQ